MLLSLERGVWAPNLHFTSPNPDIPALSDGRVQVVHRPVPVRGGIVGVNSFGFGGSNVHVILRPPPRGAADPSPGPGGVPRVLQACGRTEAGVKALLQKGRERGADDSFLSLLNDVSGLPAASMPYRGYALIGSQAEVMEVQQLQQQQAAGRPLWYVCSGESTSTSTFL